MLGNPANISFDMQNQCANQLLLVPTSRTSAPLDVECGEDEAGMHKMKMQRQEELLPEHKWSVPATPKIAYKLCTLPKMNPPAQNNHKMQNRFAQNLYFLLTKVLTIKYIHMPSAHKVPNLSL